jgi:hypothetical protein
MVSEKDLTTKSAPAALSEEKRKEHATQNLNQELHRMNSEESKWTSSPTAFDNLPPHEKPFPIEPFLHERQRLPFKMTDEDRLSRSKYLHSQELTDREPMNVPELERMIYNPIRRMYRLPADKLFNALGPFIGEQRVRPARVLLPKLAMLYMSGVFLWYQFKYNSVTWEQKGGFTMVKSQQAYLPSDAIPPELKKHDYADHGFQSRNVFKGDKYSY